MEGDLNVRHTCRISVAQVEGDPRSSEVQRTIISELAMLRFAAHIQRRPKTISVATSDYIGNPPLPIPIERRTNPET